VIEATKELLASSGNTQDFLEEFLKSLLLSGQDNDEKSLRSFTLKAKVLVALVAQQVVLGKNVMAALNEMLEKVAEVESSEGYLETANGIAAILVSLIDGGVGCASVEQVNFPDVSSGEAYVSPMALQFYHSLLKGLFKRVAKLSEGKKNKQISELVKVSKQLEFGSYKNYL
jgi:hypothetical protein